MKNYDRYNDIVEVWKTYVFPARPSPEEMVLFDILMRGQEGKKLLILGATPEFRDLGVRNKLRVTCADINPNMFEGMKKIMEEENDSEEFVECSWLEMPFEDETFDIVFAEQSINIIEVKYFDDFLKEVGRVLKKGKNFILKTINPNKDCEDKIIKDYKEQKRDIPYLYDKLLNLKKNYHNGQVGHRTLKEIFDKILKEQKISKEEYDDFFKVWGGLVESDLRLNAIDKDEMETKIRRYFKIKERIYGDDFKKHELHPIYVLTKK